MADYRQAAITPPDTAAASGGGNRADDQQARLQHLASALAASQARVADLQLKLEEYELLLQIARQAHEDERLQLTSELERHRAEFHRLLRSRSWRLTGPFRRVMRVGLRAAARLRPSTPDIPVPSPDQRDVPEHAQWVLRALQTEPRARLALRGLIPPTMVSGR